ncbi:hypothetical protein MSAN_00792700 [Mycena sanguinolenta]|uniref:Uncharacterized protein n=1 Tax=Mycena sanguinolenta TaxID=230812 RepID=A0A8H6YYU9_9AGAR|nr:hypothetical protein MSAN_00792700 [Mycena sanguinolenta]
MFSPVSLIQAFLVSFWLEIFQGCTIWFEDLALQLAAILISLCLEGFFVCIFALSVVVNVGTPKHQTVHSRAMFIVGIVTFLLATIHISINCMRMLRGYVDHSSLPGGPVGYLGVLSQWDHVFNNVIYATQSILADCVAVYRCWVLWNRNFFVVCIPFLMVFGSAVSGYMTCAIFAKIHPDSTVFNSALDAWIKTFFAIAVAQNVITTTLMAWRIADAEKQSSAYRTSKSNLIPILRILVESAALYLTAEIILLILYVANSNAQYIVLEAITPIIGITLSSFVFRAKRFLHYQSNPSAHVHEFSSSNTPGRAIPLQPMITVNITEQTDYDPESQWLPERK